MKISREEAIEHLKNMKMPHDKFYEETDETNKALIDKGNEALYMAIEALENQLTKEEVIYLIKCMGGHTERCGVEDISIKCMDKLCKIKRS